MMSEWSFPGFILLIYLIKAHALTAQRGTIGFVANPKRNSISVFSTNVGNDACYSKIIREWQKMTKQVKKEGNILTSSD